MIQNAVQIVAVISNSHDPNMTQNHFHDSQVFEIIDRMHAMHEGKKAKKWL